ncbi:unnamed protein product [Heterobilharzia americana]|nr:unnamed protein product [Heterobilharzia americana]
MPFRRHAYDFMLDDGLDTRIPVYSDEVFKQGIHFCAKVRYSICLHLFMKPNKGYFELTLF